MSIFDVNGNAIQPVYDVSGDELGFVFDYEGNQIFQPVEGSLRIMQYNVGGWWVGRATSVPASQDANYYALQTKILNNWKPDIICIEEYRDEFTVGGRTAVSVLSPFFQYIESLDGDGSVGYIGHAICSKYPILSFTKHNYGSSRQRYYTTAVIDVNGQEISVIVTHLEAKAENVSARATQSTILFNYMQTLGTCIVGGDFNSIFANSIEGEEYTTIYKQFVDAGYHLANCSEANGFHETWYNADTNIWRCLDNIIASSDISMNAVYVDQTKILEPVTSDSNWYIDHIPIIADIVLPTSEN